MTFHYEKDLVGDVTFPSFKTFCLLNGFLCVETIQKNEQKNLKPQLHTDELS